jgi:cytochrome P450
MNVPPTFPPARDSARPFDPPPELLGLLGQPLARVKQWDGIDAWLISRYEDVRAALNDQRLSADPRRPGFPEKSEAYRQTLGQDHNLRTMDNPEHGEQKRMLIRDFALKRIKELRPAIQARIESLIDDMTSTARPIDIVTDFALPVPTMVICEILGVPFEDREYFSAMSQVCTSSTATSESAGEAGRDLFAYMERLIEIKDRAPANDLVSRLVVDELRSGRLARKDVIELGRFILIAGHETTANMIALSTLALLRHPDQAAILRKPMEPAVLSNAVDELFRYLSITHTGRRRVAVEDIVVGGQLIKAGEGVIILNSVADRDETVFNNAAELDLRRINARQHLAFGDGMHRCLGAQLSKVEMELVHSTLWRRVPNLMLAVPFEEIEFYADGSVYGVRSLPVRCN